MKTDQFYKYSEEFLKNCRNEVLQSFMSNPPAGKWHPNGFAVFYIRDIENIGKLRLHVWPKGIRIALDGQPKIHSHPWDLCSLVIAGVYQDTIYESVRYEEFSPERQQEFRLKFGSPMEGDQLKLVDAWHTIIESRRRKISQGNCHCLSAGVLHSTNIPIDEFVITIMLSGLNANFEKLMLIGDRHFGERSYVRPEVAMEHIVNIQSFIAKNTQRI